MDQVGFRRGTGIDHALAVFETVCGKNTEWNSEIWSASLDLTKAFDRVEHSQLFQALREQHVPQPYIALRSRSSLHANGEPVLGRRHKCENKLLST